MNWLIWCKRVHVWHLFWAAFWSKLKFKCFIIRKLLKVLAASFRMNEWIFSYFNSVKHCPFVKGPGGYKICKMLFFFFKKKNKMMGENQCVIFFMESIQTSYPMIKFLLQISNINLSHAQGDRHRQNKYIIWKPLLFFIEFHDNPANSCYSFTKINNFIFFCWNILLPKCWAQQQTSSAILKARISFLFFCLFSVGSSY